MVLLVSVLSFSQAQGKANWTILHYTAVDNNLEGAAFNDYYEMQITGSGNGVNIVAQLDRAEGFEHRFGDWTDTRRFYIEQAPALPELDSAGQRAALVTYFAEAGYGDEADLAAEIATLDDALVLRIYENLNVGVSFDQTAVQELGEVDMGDPQALTDFIVWAVENYPAEHYMIVIGSHGGGWRGLGPDEGNHESMLDLPEIDVALGVRIPRRLRPLFARSHPRQRLGIHHKHQRHESQPRLGCAAGGHGLCRYLHGLLRRSRRTNQSRFVVSRNGGATGLTGVAGKLRSSGQSQYRRTAVSAWHSPQ
jgi:hypothetical protein